MQAVIQEEVEDKGAARETTHVGHLTNNQAQTRIQEFLGNGTDEINPVMRSHRHIQSASESPQCRMRKGLTDREVITKKDHLTNVKQEQLTLYLKEIEQRFIALDQRENELRSQLKERHEEFEMEKIVWEREMVHEKMEWDRYMQEREAVLISTVKSVMIKREKVMEELRKHVKRECQSSSNTNYSGTRRKWWSFRNIGTSIPHRSSFLGSDFKNKCVFGRHTNNKGQPAAANRSGMLQVSTTGEVILSQHSYPKNCVGHADNTAEAIRQKELEEIAKLEKTVREAEMKRQEWRAKKAEKKQRKKEMGNSGQMEATVKDVTLGEHVEQNELKVTEQERQKGIGILHRLGWNTQRRGTKLN